MEVSNILFLVILSFTLFDMDFKHKIIQWNCRGLKPKFDEIKLLPPSLLTALPWFGGLICTGDFIFE